MNSQDSEKEIQEEFGYEKGEYSIICTFGGRNDRRAGKFLCKPKLNMPTVEQKGF